MYIYIHIQIHTCVHFCYRLWENNIVNKLSGKKNYFQNLKLTPKKNNFKMLRKNRYLSLV